MAREQEPTDPVDAFLSQPALHEDEAAEARALERQRAKTPSLNQELLDVEALRLGRPSGDGELSLNQELLDTEALRLQRGPDDEA